MFHVIIFQIPQKFSFLPPFHVYVQILYCKFRVTCFYGKQISFYSWIISCKSSEANVSNNDGHSSSKLARLSEQFSFNTSKTWYELETQNECGNSSQVFSESND